MITKFSLSDVKESWFAGTLRSLVRENMAHFHDFSRESERRPGELLDFWQPEVVQRGRYLVVELAHYMLGGQSDYERVDALNLISFELERVTEDRVDATATSGEDIPLPARGVSIIGKPADADPRWLKVQTEYIEWLLDAIRRKYGGAYSEARPRSDAPEPAGTEAGGEARSRREKEPRWDVQVRGTRAYNRIHEHKAGKIAACNLEGIDPRTYDSYLEKGWIPLEDNDME